MESKKYRLQTCSATMMYDKKSCCGYRIFQIHNIFCFCCCFFIALALINSIDIILSFVYFYLVKDATLAYASVYVTKDEFLSSLQQQDEQNKRYFAVFTRLSLTIELIYTKSTNCFILAMKRKIFTRKLFLNILGAFKRRLKLYLN